MNYRKHLLATLIVVVLASLVNLEMAVAQKKGAPVIGDIIKYKRFREVRYGLVVDFFGSSGLRVEYVDDDNELQRGVVTGVRAEWKFVDRYRKSRDAKIKKRMWSSTSGKFKISGKMIGVSDEKVEIEKEDGGVLKVDIKKLSERDRSYIKQNRRMFGQDEGSEAENDYPEEVLLLIERRKELLAVEEKQQSTARKASQARPIKLKIMPFETGPSSRPNGWGSNQFVAALSGITFHTKFSGLTCSRASGDISVITSDPFKKAPTTLHILDASSGDVITEDLENGEHGPGESKIKKGFSLRAGRNRKKDELLAISPSGNRLALYRTSASGKLLEIWGREGTALSPIASFPIESFFSPRAILFSDAAGVVMNSSGQLGFFDISSDSLTPTHVVDAKSTGVRSARIRLSGDGKTLHYFDGSSFYGIDVETKQCNGGLRVLDSARSKIGAAVCVSRDGKQLAVATNGSDEDNLSIFDLATGKKTKSYTVGNVSSPTGSDSFQWIGPNLITTYRDSVYDLNLNVVIGSMSNSRGSKNLMDSQTIVYCDKSSSGSSGSVFGSSGGSNSSGQSAVGVAQMPIENIEAHSRSLSEADIVVMKSGDKVKLTMDIGGNKSMENRIREKVAKDLAEGGVTLDDNGPFSLHLTYKVGESVKENYNIIGRGVKQRTVTRQSKSLSAALKFEGDQYWGASRSVGRGSPFDEEDLNNKLNDERQFSAAKLLDLTYPSKLRKLRRSKLVTFDWD